MSMGKCGTWAHVALTCQEAPWVSLWGVILSLFQSTVVKGLRLPKDHIPGGINKC